MSSRRVKTMIQEIIRSLKRDHRDGLSLVSSTHSYSRGKSFEYSVTVTVEDEEYTKFSVMIIESGGKKQRDWHRHMDQHHKNGDKIGRMQPSEELNQDGEPRYYTMLECCDNPPSLGGYRIVRRS